MNASRILCLPQTKISRSRGPQRTGKAPRYYALNRHHPSAVHRTRRSTRGIYLFLGMVVVALFFLLFRLTTQDHADNPAQRSRVAEAQKEIHKLSSALDHYAQDNFTYPSTQQGLEALVAEPSNAPLAPNWKRDGYVKRLPMDPWGRPYQYHEPGTHGSAFDLFSLGADGKRGGSGINADIGNWNSPG